MNVREMTFRWKNNQIFSFQVTIVCKNVSFSNMFPKDVSVQQNFNFFSNYSYLYIAHYHAWNAFSTIQVIINVKLKFLKEIKENKNEIALLLISPTLLFHQFSLSSKILAIDFTHFFLIHLVRIFRYICWSCWCWFWCCCCCRIKPVGIIEWKWDFFEMQQKSSTFQSETLDPH